MKIIIPGGNGQVGRMLVRALVRDGHECVVLTRGRPVLPAGARAVAWDGRSLGPWTTELDGADVVINLAGRSVDCRYHERNLAEMMRSRVDSTRVIGQAMAAAKHPPRVWLQAATATIYAHRFDAPNDEFTGEIGGREPGVPALWARSIDIAKAWEAAVDAAPTPRTRKVILRSAMVMSPDHGGVFSVLAGLARLGVGAQGDGRQYVSWVHEHDFVAAVKFLIAREDLTGVFNVCSPHPLPNRDFMATLNRAVGMKLAVPVPGWALEIGAFFLRTETELILKSRRVVPARLLREGFVFRHPDWPDAATELVSRAKTTKGHAMKFTRGQRIALEVLGPPAIGAAIMTTVFAGFAVAEAIRKDEALHRLKQVAEVALIAVVGAYILAGMQSVLYALVMEWRFARGLDPRSWRSVGLSSGLGFLSGAVIVLFMGWRGELLHAGPWIICGGLGLLVGLALGLLIKRLSR